MRAITFTACEIQNHSHMFASHFVRTFLHAIKVQGALLVYQILFFATQFIKKPYKEAHTQVKQNFRYCSSDGIHKVRGDSRCQTNVLRAHGVCVPSFAYMKTHMCCLYTRRHYYTYELRAREWAHIKYMCMCEFLVLHITYMCVYLWWLHFCSPAMSSSRGLRACSTDAQMLRDAIARNPLHICVQRNVFRYHCARAWGIRRTCMCATWSPHSYMWNLVR